MFLSGQKISFGYTADKLVLNEVSFTLPKSKTLSIVGASGCGKSTLLRIISGILPQTKDHIISGAITVNTRTPDEYRKLGKLAFMFQEATLMPNLSVRENIAFPLKIRGINSERKVFDLLETVGLEDHADKLPKQLSGGMKTRIALARSFVTEPELLLLDEPFSALDIAWKSKLYVELEKLLDRYDTTVVLVTHDVQEALLLADNVLVFDKWGGIQARHTIQTNKTVSDRVFNISGFMNEVYEDYLLPIQDAIMNVATRPVQHGIVKGESKENEKVDILHIA